MNQFCWFLFYLKAGASLVVQFLKSFFCQYLSLWILIVLIGRGYITELQTSNFRGRAVPIHEDETVKKGRKITSQQSLIVQCTLMDLGLSLAGENTNKLLNSDNCSILGIPVNNSHSLNVLVNQVSNEWLPHNIVKGNGSLIFHYNVDVIDTWVTLR